MAKTVEIFTDLSFKECYEEIDTATLRKAYLHIISELSTYMNKKSNVAPKKVKVEGVTYHYMGDLSRLTVAERMDILAMGEDVLNQVNKLMAILYRSDKVGVKDAMPIFSQSFPPDVFYQSWVFFSHKLTLWNNAIVAILEAQSQMIKEIEKIMRMELKLQEASKFSRLFIRWQIFLTGMWMQLKPWFMLNFYRGKIFGRKRLNEMKNLLKHVRDEKLAKIHKR